MFTAFVRLTLNPTVKTNVLSTLWFLSTNIRYANTLTVKNNPVEIKAFIESHGYRWAAGEYVRAQDHIRLQCPAGHLWSTSWKAFKEGSRCPTCQNRARVTPEKARAEFEKAGYAWLSGNFINGKSRLLLQCPIGHEYLVSWSRFAGGHRCFECFGTKTLKLEHLRAVAAGHGFSIASNEYKNAKTPMTFVCAKGHTSEQQWRCWKTHKACPSCTNNSRSAGEMGLAKWLVDCGYKVEIRRRDLLPSKQEIDIYLPDHKYAIEYNGLRYHSEVFCDVFYHQNKLNACLALGVRLITIFEDEWANNAAAIKEHIQAQIAGQHSAHGRMQTGDGILVDRRFSEGDDLLKAGHTRQTVPPDHMLVKGSKRVPKDYAKAKPYMKRIWDCGYYLYPPLVMPLT